MVFDDAVAAVRFCVFAYDLAVKDWKRFSQLKGEGLAAFAEVCLGAGLLNHC